MYRKACSQAKPVLYDMGTQDDMGVQALKVSGRERQGEAAVCLPLCNRTRRFGDASAAGPSSDSAHRTGKWARVKQTKTPTGKGQIPYLL
jgi:hypothetical protein